ncbi:MAG TPA: GNAT family N-acetyltransferase [Actinomycetota bacterium]|nr:GNAT family N-acetyltransferase [Actinomycetota bacterium]
MGDDIFQRLYGSDWRRRQQHDVEEVLHGEEEASRVWVVERDKEVIAFVAATLKVDEGMGQVRMLAVDPDSQNDGIGTLLTEMATEWIRDAGLPIAVIQTGGDVGHAPARRTYEKAGYVPVPAVYYFRPL